MPDNDIDSVILIGLDGLPYEAGGSSGGVSMADDAAFTVATDSFTPVGGVVTADSVDSGDGGAFAMLANRQQKVTLYDSGGVELAVGGGTQYTEDAAAAANPVGNVPILVRADTPAGVTTTDGDNVAQRGTDYGAAYVTLLDTGGSPVAVGGGTQYTEGDTDASITGTAILWEDAADTLTAVSASKPLPISDAGGAISIDDGGNVITVDGTVAVTNAGLTALNGAISGTEVQVDVLTMPSVAVTNTGTFAVQAAGDVAHDGIDSGNPVKVGGYASSTTPTSVASGDRVNMWLNLGGATVISGGVTEMSGDGASLGVPLVQRVGNTSAGPLGVLPLLFNGSTFDRQRGDTSNGLDVDVTRVSGNVTVVNGGTFATQVDGAALTALQLIDDPVVVLGTATYTETTSKGNAVAAVRRDADTTLVDTTNEFAPLIVDARGFLKVEAFAGESITVTEASASSSLTSLQLIDDIVYTDDTSTHATGTSKGALIMGAAAPTDTAVNANDIGAVAMTVDRALYGSIRDWAGTAVVTGSGTATGALRVELANNGTGLVGLNAGTNAIGKLAANSGIDIGDVDVTSVVAGTGATNLGKAEDAGHTTGDTGVYVLGVRNDTPNTALTNTDADYASLTTDRVGGVRTALYETDFAVLGTNHVKKYYTNAGAVTDGIIWSPAAGKRWYVTDLIVNTSAAATVTFEDDLAGGDSAVMKFEFAANSGIAHKFQTPLFSGEDAADLLVTTSAGNIYITAVGYEI